MNRLLIFLGVIAGLASYPQDAAAARTQHLFKIERSKNANTVFYDLKLDQAGHPDEDEPIDAYWMRYASTGKRKELKWFERKMAYGVKVKGRPNEASVDIQLKAFKQRTVEIRKIDGAFRALVTIGGGRAQLSKIFVATKESGVIPKVLYIELFGKNLTNGTDVYEKIVND